MEKQVTQNNAKNTTTIRVDLNFKAWLESHGRYGERHQDIIVRLIGKDMYKPSGDVPSETYSKEDIDSQKTKKKRREDARKM